MKSRKWLTAAFSTLALGAFGTLGSAYTALPASAQTRPATSVASSTFNICSFEPPTSLLCIVSNGAGQQVNIAGKDFAVFHVVNTANGYEQVENAGGNCLRAYADGTVGLANGGCDSTVSAEFWKVKTDTSTLRSTYESEKYPGEFMGTFGDSDGDFVFIAAPQTGFFSGWVNV